jgi:hypothetical protein
MNKIRRLLDTKKLQEKQKEDEDRLMKIGLKKEISVGDKLDGPIEYSIERMQASIDSGFVTIPDNLTEDEILEFLLK